MRRPLEPRQYLAIRYTERLADAGAVASVGSRGDSFDNALAETIIGLYKTELIRRRGPGRASTRSSTPPWNGSTGSTIAGSWSPLVLSRRPSSKPHSEQRRIPFHSSTRASDEPGAVHGAFCFTSGRWSFAVEAIEALQALLTNSIERASPFLRTSPPVAEAARARHFARRPGASLTYFEGTDLAVVAHGHATIIDERDPDFAELDAVQVECGGESSRR